MDETLRQLGGLLLGSVPTVVMLLLMYAIYTVVVHKPLARVLAERRAKTEGAIEKARADIAAAEARTAEYEQRLREARLAVFKSQEARRQQALQARTEAVARARERAQEPGNAPETAAPASSEQSPKKHEANKADERPGFGAQLAKETREAAGEDKTAQFKQSASVRWLSKLTGGNLQHAYWLAVLLNFLV